VQTLIICGGLRVMADYLQEEILKDVLK